MSSTRPLGRRERISAARLSRNQTDTVLLNTLALTGEPLGTVLYIIRERCDNIGRAWSTRDRIPAKLGQRQFSDLRIPYLAPGPILSPGGW